MWCTYDLCEHYAFVNAIFCTIKYLPRPEFHAFVTIIPVWGKGISPLGCKTHRLSNELLLNFHIFFHDFVVVFHIIFCIQKLPAPISCGCRIYCSHVSSLWMYYQIICEKVSLWLIQIDTFHNFKIVFDFSFNPFNEWYWIKVRKNESFSPESRMSCRIYLLFFSSSSFPSPSSNVHFTKNLWLWMCQTRMKFNQICFLFNQNVFCL